MHRLSGEAAGFLYLDLPNQPMTGMYLFVLSPGRADDGPATPLTPEEFRDHLGQRLDILPHYRWRIVHVPGGIHHPVTIADPDFRLERHLGHVRLPEPGTPRQLDELCARLLATPLQHDRPLWHFTLVDGLADGRQAIVARLHHSLGDGDAGHEVLQRLCSAEPPSSDSSISWIPEAVPGRRQLIGDARRAHRESLRGVPRLIGRTRRGFAAVAARQKSGPVAVPRPTRDTTACSLNDAFTSGRAYAHALMDLAEIRDVKAAAGTSINDVMLAVVAGGLTRYLGRLGDLPAAPLTVSVPVSVKTPDTPARTSGNRFSSLTTSLATDVVDPWERLARIAAVTTEAKYQLELFGPELLPDWLDVIPPFIARPAVRGHNRNRRDHRERADVNALVSNVRGPATLLPFGRATVDEIYTAGPPSNGVGCNISLHSYAGMLAVGIACFADAVPDPDVLAADLGDALAELREIAAWRSRA